MMYANHVKFQPQLMVGSAIMVESLKPLVRGLVFHRQSDSFDLLNRASPSHSSEPDRRRGRNNRMLFLFVRYVTRGILPFSALECPGGPLMPDSLRLL